jgi:prephenate dehydratase
VNVYYLGPESTFSHLAAKKVFTDRLHSLIAASSFDEIFKAVNRSDDTIGVVPVENSITSNVHENIDRLFAGDLRIVGEAFLEISLHLIGAEGTGLESISTIVSHPKALEQCRNYLSSFRGTVLPSASTSEAVEAIRTGARPGTALIGSRVLAESAGLSLLKTDLGDVKSNSTRFVFVSQNDAGLLTGPCNRLTFTFQVRHEPGALVKVLSALGSVGANLTKIESRPIPGRDWEYLFWVDLEIEPEKKEEVVEVVRDATLEYHILGCYPTGQVYPS